MSEGKMREEFEKTHAHIYHQFDRRPSGDYTNSFIQAKWEAWEACAAIKDAEIAELESSIDQQRTKIIELYEERDKCRHEVAARDLMIKELQAKLAELNKE